MWKAPLVFPFISPVWEGEVNTELTPKSLLHADLPGNLHLLHFVNLLLPEYLRKKLLIIRKLTFLLPFFIRNEREGIPANLIQQLDVCVEIPQQGIIRSLNVHVSGALLIWEYTRQQLLRQGDPCHQVRAFSETSNWFGQTK